MLLQLLSDDDDDDDGPDKNMMSFCTLTALLSDGVLINQLESYKSRVLKGKQFQLAHLTFSTTDETFLFYASNSETHFQAEDSSVSSLMESNL